MDAVAPRPSHIEKYARGNPHSYRNGCRCTDCTLAWAAYRRTKEHGPNGRRARVRARLRVAGEQP